MTQARGGYEEYLKMDLDELIQLAQSQGEKRTPAVMTTGRASQGVRVNYVKVVYPNDPYSPGSPFNL